MVVSVVSDMAEIQDLVRGMPVEVGQINRSLKALWEQEGDCPDQSIVDQFRSLQRSPGCAEREHAANGTDNARACLSGHSLGGESGGFETEGPSVDQCTLSHHASRRETGLQ